MGSTQATLDYRKRRKLDLMRVAGNKCCLCGYDKVPSALEFHHIDPDEKSYGISSGGVCHDLETDLLEVKKTVLVCANCHREIHDGQYTKEQLREKQVYDEQVAQELREKKAQLSTRTVYHCKNCGAEISRGAVLCESCSREARRKAERPSREELKQLIRTTPFTRIAAQYGVTDNAIRKWCDAEKLPRKVADIKKYTDEAWATL